MATFTHLLYLEKVCEKICFKEYHLVEQNLHELEAEKAEVAKTGSNLSVVETINILEMVSPVSEVHQLPLTDLFVFNFSFS